MNIWFYILLILAQYNAYAARGCQYDYRTFTWNCPAEPATTVVAGEIPERKDKPRGTYPVR